MNCSHISRARSSPTSASFIPYEVETTCGGFSISSNDDTMSTKPFEFSPVSPTERNVIGTVWPAMPTEYWMSRL